MDSISIDMDWIENILQDGEDIIFRSKSHHSIVVVPLVSVHLLFFLGHHGLLFWAAVIIALSGVFKYFYYEHVITNRRIISKYGFFYIRYRELPLEKVDNIICWQNMADKYFGTGLIMLFGTGIRQTKFRRVANAMDFKHAVYSQLSTEPEHYFENQSPG